MKEFGAYIAKTHLAELLHEVLAGKPIAISHHGTLVAVMMPVPSRQKASPQDVIAKLRRLQERARLDGLSLRNLIEDGRKKWPSLPTHRSRWHGVSKMKKARIPSSFSSV